jgi:hypothetical protein
MDKGLVQAVGNSIATPCPPSWLGRTDAPLKVPANSYFNRLTPVEIENLQAQIAYDKSEWNYAKVSDNELGRYQFGAEVLELYGFLYPDSVSHYGKEAVNYRACWTSTPLATQMFTGFLYNVADANNFLLSTAAQEHLAYWHLYNLYLELKKINAIQDTDANDIVAGMLYVAWELGVGTAPTSTHRLGTGAYAWRYSGIGEGANAYNSGRYAITILSQ